MRVAAHEQLQQLVEQARGRGLGDQRRELRDRGPRRILDREPELRRQAHRAQHAHRILAITLLGIADQSQAALLDVGEAADVVAHGEILDRVVQRVHREVAADRVVLDAAVDVVAHDAAVDHVPVARAVVDVRTERGDLDRLGPEHHMRQAEAPPDQAAIAELLLDLLGRRVGRDVEVLRVAAEQQVAHGTADEIRLEPGVAQAIQHAQRVRADVPTRDAVLFARNDAHGDGLLRHGDRSWEFVGLHRIFAALPSPGPSPRDCPARRNGYTTRPVFRTSSRAPAAGPRTAVTTLPSSSGPGHRPLKAGTRVRTS